MKIQPHGTRRSFGSIRMARGGLVLTPLLSIAFGLVVTWQGAFAGVPSARGKATVRAPAKLAVRDASIVEVISKAGEVKDLLEKLSDEGVPQALESIDKLPKLTDQQKAALKQEVLAFKEKLDPKLNVLKRFNSVFEGNDTLQKFVDFYGEYKEMREAADQLHNDLERRLSDLSLLLKNHGADVPIIGKALEAYGAVTQALIGAIERIRQTILDNLGGDVGAGIPPEINLRNKRLFELHPDLYDAYRYTPQGPDFIYRPQAEAVQPLLLWDEAAGTWYVVRQEASAYQDVEMIYRDTLQYCDRKLAADQLYRLTLAPAFEDIAKLRKTGAEICQHLNAIPFTDPDYPVLSQVYQAASDQVVLPTGKPEAFSARFALDYRFRAATWTRLKAIHDGFGRAGRVDLAVRTRNRAVQWGCEEAATWSCAGLHEWVMQPASSCLLESPDGWMASYDYRFEVAVAPSIDPTKGTVSLRGLKVAGQGWKSGRGNVPRKKLINVQATLHVERVEPANSVLYVYCKLSATGTLLIDLPNGGKTVACKSDLKLPVTFLYDANPGLSGLKDVKPAVATLDASWSEPRNDAVPQPGAAQPTLSGRGFDGEWNVAYFNGPIATGKPSLQQRMKIQSDGGAATGSVKMRDDWMPYYKGPLSSDGRVWNATHEAAGIVVQRLEGVRVSDDGNILAGKWSGAEPHQNAWIGVRAGTGPQPPAAPTKPAASVTPAKPAAPVPSPKAPQGPAQKLTVELSNANRNATVTAGPGAELTVRVATYAGTGYTVQMVPPDRTAATPLGGPRAEPMRTGSPSGKPLLGAGTWQVYDFKVAPGAKGSFRLAFQFSRSGRRAELEYSLTVNVRPGRGS